ncbi:MAG: exopolyphosphatase [Candidatus Marisimplicoccus sp.]
MDLNKIAAIDIGSNAVRMLISYVIKNEKGELHFQKNSYLRLPLRLGEDSFLNQSISDSKIDSFINAINSMKYIMMVHEVDYYLAYGTSALREAKNSETIKSKVKSETGIVINIIDGIKEATIISNAKPIEKNNPFRKNLYIDVGGGSTELSFVQNAEKTISCSFNIGTVRDLNKINNDGVWDEIKTWIKDNLDNDFKLRLYGTGGNINKIQNLTNTKVGKPISYFSMITLLNNLSKIGFEERVIKYNLNPDRADVIVPALKIFLRTMEWSGSNKIFVPKVGLVDGMIKEVYYNNVGNKL